MKTQSAPSLASLAESLGLAITCSAPSGGVDKSQGKDGKPWPHIAYTVTLTRNDKPVWSGPFKLGIGHVKMPAKMKGGGYNYAEAKDLCGGECPKDFQEMEAKMAGVLAIRQKVSPDLPTVLSSLISDGQPDFDSQSFEDWAGDYGYDTDSRSAEAAYNACVAIGRQLRRAFTTPELEQLREAASEL